MTDTLISTIEAAWENRAELGFSTEGAVREAVAEALNLLDSGNARVAEPAGEGWRVNQWLKKAVLLSFRLTDNALIPGGPGGSHCGTRCPRNFRAGARRSSAPPVSALCLGPLHGMDRISPGMSC